MQLIIGKLCVEYHLAEEYGFMLTNNVQDITITSIRVWEAGAYPAVC